MSRISAEEARKMAKAYKKGSTLSEIGHRRKIGINRVKEVLLDEGVTIRRPGSSIKGDQERDARLTKMAKMYETHTLQQVGDEFGLSRERVRQILSAAIANPANDGSPRLKNLSKGEKVLAQRYLYGA